MSWLGLLKGHGDWSLKNRAENKGGSRETNEAPALIQWGMLVAWMGMGWRWWEEVRFLPVILKRAQRILPLIGWIEGVRADEESKDDTKCGAWAMGRVGLPLHWDETDQGKNHASATTRKAFLGQISAGYMEMPRHSRALCPWHFPVIKSVFKRESVGWGWRASLSRWVSLRWFDSKW